MKLIEKFSRVHRQQVKLEEILHKEKIDGWLLAYLDYYPAPCFMLLKDFNTGHEKNVIFKLVECQLIYFKSNENVTDEDIRETKALLNEVLKTEHDDWTEVLI